MAVPVLGVRVRVHDQRVRTGALHHAVARVREGVRRDRVGERVTLRRPLVLLVLAGVAAHLCEPRVREEAPGAGHVRIDGVEDLPPLRVHVIAVVDELADHARAERLPVRVRPLEARDGIRRAARVDGVVEQHGHQVADARDAQPHHAGARGFVDEFVDPTGLEPAFHVAGGGRGAHAHRAVDCVRLGECPGVRRDGYARVALVLAQRHRRVGGIEVERGVGLDARRAAQRHPEHALLLGDELLAHPAAHRRAVLHGIGQIGDEQPVARDEVALPR